MIPRSTQERVTVDLSLLAIESIIGTVGALTAVYGYYLSLAIVLIGFCIITLGIGLHWVRRILWQLQ